MNSMSLVDMILIFLVVAGPTKPLAVLAAATGNMSKAERRAIVLKTIITAASVLYTFAFFGQGIIKFFHVSVPALEIAGGLILLIFALGIVLGDGGHDDSHANGGDIAVYPLAMPLMASPQAIVAIVVISSRVTEMSEQINIYVGLGITLAINFAIMMAAATMMKAGTAESNGGGGIGAVVLRVVAILLAALAVELMILGLRDLGIIPPGAAH